MTETPASVDGGPGKCKMIVAWESDRHCGGEAIGHMGDVPICARCLISALNDDPALATTEAIVLYRHRRPTRDAAPCRCGSGAHPRRCEVHPQGYDLHRAELTIESLTEELEHVRSRDAAMVQELRQDLNDARDQLERQAEDNWELRAKLDPAALREEGRVQGRAEAFEEAAVVAEETDVVEHDGDTYYAQLGDARSSLGAAARNIRALIKPGPTPDAPQGSAPPALAFPDKFADKVTAILAAAPQGSPLLGGAFETLRGLVQVTPENVQWLADNVEELRGNRSSPAACAAAVLAAICHRGNAAIEARISPEGGALEREMAEALREVWVRGATIPALHGYLTKWRDLLARPRRLEGHAMNSGEAERMETREPVAEWRGEVTGGRQLFLAVGQVWSGVMFPVEMRVRITKLEPIADPRFPWPLVYWEDAETNSGCWNSGAPAFAYEGARMHASQPPPPAIPQGGDAAKEKP